jgi:hypothetical protein
MDWFVCRLVVGSLFSISFLLAPVNSCCQMGHRNLSKKIDELKWFLRVVCLLKKAELMERDEFTGPMAYISRCEGRWLVTLGNKSVDELKVPHLVNSEVMKS